MITEFPLFHGFTLDGARMLLDSGEVKLNPQMKCSSRRR